MHLLDIAAITVAGLMVGNELAIALFVHPTLTSLPPDAHRRSASALARTLGRFMPIWYALTALLGIAEVILSRHRTGHWPPLLTASAALWILSILYTVLALVPVNNRIAAAAAPATAEPDSPALKIGPAAGTTNPANTDSNLAGMAPWLSLRQRWDTLHRWRVLLLLTAFLLLLEGIINAPSLP